ncbi:uracil-xanthine permease family protein [Treponema phagedenis]|uniref:uracil-xanthine permease family protein n=1 Tax=Treponema phagedenis TaxID=162 RepID=UPI00201751FE|nr:solute carrier family 23 protein [Treponema phagedenis]
MSTTELKYLQFVRFKDITQWDLKRYLNQLIKSRFPIVTLNEHIKEESTKYNISDPQTNYGMLGVNNQTGIFDAYIESGSKIKQKYKRMENGWIAYALGGAFCAGLFYAVVAGIIKVSGTNWLTRALPPVVIGSVIIVIGLNLAPTAMGMVMNDGQGNYSLVYLSIAMVTLAVTVICNIFLKGFFEIIPILIGLVCGYLFTLIMGNFFPAYHIISFDKVREAAWFGLPSFTIPKFSFVPIITFLIVSLATICEHLGDILVLSKVVGVDFYKDPGLHRTLLGDGLATSWAALWGGPPNTTYGENIGVMAITKVYSIWVIGGAAVIAILLSFFQKFGALIQTIPTPVMGGISMLLFGIIASSGLRTVVESGVDYKDKRNLTISSVIMVIGIGGGRLAFNITGDLKFELAGVALATLIGIILNMVFPQTKEK